MADPVTVTPYHSDDRDVVLAMAPRLCVGVAPWRPADDVRSAVRGWFEESVDTTHGCSQHYGALGYLDEEVRLTRTLTGP